MSQLPFKDAVDAVMANADTKYSAQRGVAVGSLLAAFRQQIEVHSSMRGHGTDSDYREVAVALLAQKGALIFTSEFEALAALRCHSVRPR